MKKRFKRLGAMLPQVQCYFGATACGGGSNSSTTGNAAKSEDSASTTETGERQVVVTLTHPNM